MPVKTEGYSPKTLKQVATTLVEPQAEAYTEARFLEVPGAQWYKYMKHGSYDAAIQLLF